MSKEETSYKKYFIDAPLGNWTIEDGTVEGSIRYIRIGSLRRSLRRDPRAASDVTCVEVHRVDG
jgi:hypothetical protein